jgi:putative transposase
MESQPEHYAPGRPPDVSNTFVFQVEKECTVLTVSSVSSGSNQLGDDRTSMQELAAQNNTEISIVKSKISRKRTLTTLSSKTSPQVSTSKEKGYKPFWNTSSMDWSTRLWSCIETGLQELEQTSWSLSSQRLARNSWFTVQMRTPRTTMISQMTSSQLQPSSSLPITDVVLQKIARDEEKKAVTAMKAKERREEIKRQKIQEPKKASRPTKKTYTNPVRARKIRIYPDKEQEQGIRKWLGAVRFCYNLLVASQKNVGQGGVNLASLRKIVKEAHESHVWLNDIPGEIKDVAVRDMDKARKAHFAKLKKRKETNPDASHKASFKFRSKKDPQESFEVRGRDMIRDAGMFAFLNLAKLKSSETLPVKVDCAVRFIRDRLGRYFLIVPHEVAKKSENQAPQQPESIVSLDPGVRTFQTTYDASGLSTEWGKDDMKTIFILCRKADKIQGAWQAKKGTKRRATKRVWLRLLDKIKNKVKEVHRKMAVWLCENYKVILIPTFETSQMVRRGKRKINTMTARNMLTWSHYGFRQLLKTKAELYPWVNVVECEEPYTSKTCGSCGEINSKLGGAKTFRCKSCGYIADRDINGARNILLRYLSLFCKDEREVSGSM